MAVARPAPTPIDADMAEEVDRADKGQTRKSWQRYLDAELGLRNYWYPAFFSSELTDGQTRGEVVCGERILFKRVKGKVFGMEDRCPHRGVPFSARPECFTTNTITCWFHGFTFDVRNGELTTIISEEDSALVGKLRLPVYPTFEHNNVVFVWIGDGEPVPPEHDIPATFLDANVITRPLLRVKLRCNWRLAAENGFDSGHIYGHRNWHGLVRYNKVSPVGRCTISKDNVRWIEDEDQPKGINIFTPLSSWVGRIVDEDEEVLVHTPLVDPNNPPPAINDKYRDTFGCFLPGYLDASGFPRDDLRHWEWYVPIDEHHHMYTVIQGGDGSTPERGEAFLKEWREQLATDVWTMPGIEPEGFNNFDALGRWAIEHSYGAEDWWHRERMYKPDYPIIEWRKLVAKHARGIQKRGNFQPMRPPEQYE
ncbi:MAG: Rieske 2Fe-2S domain-containing protein, partial [Chloroflexi bacterium]|nr:Rieske 2Fe-2S domain-containing protein [Chloroflexota bacterium]